MKFKSYLNEGRSVGIDKDKAIKEIQSNCMKNYNYFMKQKEWLFRGIEYQTDEYLMVDTNKGRDRVSANTQNYFTLLMDNLPSWKKYPKRSHSIICSSSEESASSYGELYIVIPYDNTNVGVAPDGDIWFSFKEVMVVDFNEYVNKMFRKYKLPSKTFKDLSSSLTELNKSGVVPKGKFGVFDKDKDIMKEINKIYSPEHNDFKRGLKNIHIRDSEVWVQGKSVMIAENIFWGMMEEISEI